MTHQLRYQLLVQPEPRTDGSGNIDHDIQAIYSDDAGVTWQSVPGSGYHKTVSIPTADLEAVAATGGGTAAITAAYKDAIRDNVNTTPLAITPPSHGGWDATGLDTYLEVYEAWQADKIAIDDAAATIAATANNFLTVTLGLEYPIEFSL